MDILSFGWDEGRNEIHRKMNSSTSMPQIEDHGIALDKLKIRVKCKYCGKVVCGFTRLKHHLAGVGPDVIACPQVPDDVKSCIKTSLIDRKTGRLLKEVGQLFYPDLPLKRKLNFCSISGTKSLASTSAPHGTSKISSSNFCTVKKPVFIKIKDNNTVIKEEEMDESMSIASRSIAKFFFEAGIDLNTISLPSFKEMLDATNSSGFGFRVPIYEELNGNILEAEFKNVNEQVEELKRSWEKTGCSILLDCWTDQTGKFLISFLVHCPNGTIFLKSVNVTNAAWDVNALFVLLEKVVQLVGARYVVQIIAHDPTYYLEVAGKRLVGVSGKYKYIVWARCVDDCINLILERIANLEDVRTVLDQAKTVTSFIYSHKLPLELMKKYIRGKELVRSTCLRWVSVFITLEIMMSERENLLHMFNSSTWKRSSWASKTKGQDMLELVEGPKLWASIANILKVTNPLISFLHQMSSSAPMGFLYDYMDRAKEEIERNFGGKEAEASYMPYWEIIDDIWNNYLHNALHPTAAFFNPSIYYSENFVLDGEVSYGISDCLWSIEDSRHRDMVILQLDAYECCFGSLGEHMAKDQRSKVPPVDWWSVHGRDYPELQNFATRLLSQTCSTAARYKLKRNITERLHAGGRTGIDQQKLADLEFVQNNLRLWNTNYSMNQSVSVGTEEVNPVNDWIVEGLK